MLTTRLRSPWRKRELVGVDATSTHRQGLLHPGNKTWKIVVFKMRTAIVTATVEDCCLQDDDDSDLGEDQGSPLLLAGRSQLGVEESLGPLRNQNLQMDLFQPR